MLSRLTSAVPLLTASLACRHLPSPITSRCTGVSLCSSSSSSSSSRADSKRIATGRDGDSSTRSTHIIEPEETYHVGAEERKERLHAELSLRGLTSNELEALLNDDVHRGSPAFRTYNSFVFPKSAGALASAEKPGRLATIAQSICFLHREQEANRNEWLRNHDRTLSELPFASTRFPLTLVLDNVRSAHNVGNLLRAAEAARCERVFCCGITPTPPHPSVLKTAMGSADYVPSEHSPSTLKVVQQLQARGVSVWAAETCPGRSIDLRESELPSPLALVLGNELIGVDTKVLAQCDGVVEVPLFGVKNSLNVATAGTIVMWEALKQWDVGDRPTEDGGGGGALEGAK